MNKTDETNNVGVDFIGVGAPRTGTSWIYKCLKDHPEICVSSKKEIHFFNKKQDFHQKHKETNYKKGIEWYLSHFSHCTPSKITGEMDTRYIYEYQAMKRIKKHFPEAKIIVTLRNPIERSYSNYYYHIKKNPDFKEKAQSFEDAIKKQPQFLDDSKYASHLENCFEIFPEEQIFLGLYKTLSEDPKRFIQDLYNFLEVKKTFQPEHLTQKVNVGNSLFDYSSVLRSFKNRLQQFTVGQKIVKSLKTQTFAKKIYNSLRINVERPEMKTETRERLRDYFEDDIKQVEKLIGKNLNHWE